MKTLAALLALALTAAADFPRYFYSPTTGVLTRELGGIGTAYQWSPALGIWEVIYTYTY